MGKLTILNTDDKNEMRAAIEELKRTLPDMIEHTKIVAKIRKANYDAHIEEGFTPEQALTLCASVQL